MESRNRRQKGFCAQEVHRVLLGFTTGSKFFTVIDLCSEFIILIDETSQYFFAFTWEEKQFAWTVMPQGFTESLSNFSQILKADLDDIKFPRGSTLLQYVDELLLYSPSQVSPEDSIHLLKILASKGIRLPKKNCSFPKPRFDT